MTKTTTEFQIGSWERPDAGGIVRRGEAVSFTGFAEEYGEGPRCFAGHEFGCERTAVMEVYGLYFCEAHGEEAASAALEEVYHDLEASLDMLSHSPTGFVSSHLAHALETARSSIPGATGGVDDEALLRAFPLDEQSREKIEAETPMYIEDLKEGRRDFGMAPPLDVHLCDRTTVCRFMRLAFEERATWLVEILEKHREASAAQAAWALALYNEAGIR